MGLVDEVDEHVAKDLRPLKKETVLEKKARMLNQESDSDGQ
jgi:hypothetical protein